MRLLIFCSEVFRALIIFSARAVALRMVSRSMAMALRIGFSVVRNSFFKSRISLAMVFDSDFVMVLVCLFFDACNGIAEGLKIGVGVVKVAAAPLGPVAGVIFHADAIGGDLLGGTGGKNDMRQGHAGADQFAVSGGFDAQLLVGVASDMAAAFDEGADKFDQFILIDSFFTALTWWAG